MLKQWMINPDLDSIHVEEKYKTWVENLRTDRYVTVYSPVLLMIIFPNFSELNPTTPKTSFYIVATGHVASVGENLREVQGGKRLCPIFGAGFGSLVVAYDF